MTKDTVMAFIGVGFSLCNCLVTLLTFPRKKSMRFTLIAIAAFCVAFFLTLHRLGAIAPTGIGLPGVLFLPLIVWLFGGHVSQRVFHFFLQMLAVSFQVAFAEAVGGLFSGYGEPVSFAVFLGTAAILITTYLLLAYRFRQILVQKLYRYGGGREWTLYACGAIFSYALISSVLIAPESLWMVLMLLYILWSFLMLCFAIVNTHEKAQLKHEAEFAQEMIAAAQGHYRKMGEIQDALRIARHDYKYHLDTASELIGAGKYGEAARYISDGREGWAQNDWPDVGEGAELNALLAGYEERCAKQGIGLEMDIAMPADCSIPSYEMCIVVGNLLENAIHACGKQGGGRRVQLAIHTQGVHLAVMVKNTLIGWPILGGARLASSKEEGGIGLKSVRAVAARHGGELMTEWDDVHCSTYVLMRL